MTPQLHAAVEAKPAENECNAIISTPAGPGTLEKWGPPRHIGFTGSTKDFDFRAAVGPLPSDELTHGIYPYPARLVRHIPRLLLADPSIAGKYDFLIDPFCGSGTVLLEAQTRGLRPYGFDQNPIAALVSRVKTTPRPSTMLHHALVELVKTAKSTRKKLPYPRYLNKWYDHHTISILERLIVSKESTSHQDARDFLDLTIALFARKSSIADPAIPVPVRDNTKLPLRPNEKWNLLIATGVRLIKQIERLSSSYPTATVHTCDARDPTAWARLPKRGTGIIFTSPPYGAAQKYVRSTSLESGWLGFAAGNGTLNLSRNSIGREYLGQEENLVAANFHNAKIEESLRGIAAVSPQRAAIYTTYFTDMNRVFEQVRETTNIKTVVIVSGENTVAGIQLRTGEHLRDLLGANGFERVASLRDTIKGRSLLTSRNGSVSPIRTELVEIFKL